MMKFHYYHYIYPYMVYCYNYFRLQFRLQFCLQFFLNHMLQQVQFLHHRHYLLFLNRHNYLVHLHMQYEHMHFFHQLHHYYYTIVDQANTLVLKKDYRFLTHKHEHSGAILNAPLDIFYLLKFLDYILM